MVHGGMDDAVMHVLFASVLVWVLVVAVVAVAQVIGVRIERVVQKMSMT